MAFKSGKIFYDNKYNIELFEIEQNNNYYKYFRDKIDHGFKPIIISSNIMIKILKKYFTENKADIVSIVLLEEDPEYQANINNIITTVKSNRDYFIDLVEEISFLSENDNVEIKSLRFKYRKNQELVDISITLNGSLNYSNNKSTEEELVGIKIILSEYLEWLYK